MVIDSLNHKGTGILQRKNRFSYQVDCKSFAQTWTKVNYMNNVALTLDAVLELI
jgi:hypothetical protein